MDRKNSAYYVLYQPSSNNCAAVVSYMAGYFKSASAYYSSIKDLAIGDIVFFQNSSGLSHVGICIDWSDSNKTFTTIEGNKNNKVSQCTYSYSDVGGYVTGTSMLTTLMLLITLQVVVRNKIFLGARSSFAL